MELQLLLKNSIQEFQLNSNLQNREKTVRTELSFYQDTHNADVIQQPDLFQIKGISHDE